MGKKAAAEYGPRIRFDPSTIRDAAELAVIETIQADASLQRFPYTLRASMIEYLRVGVRPGKKPEFCSGAYKFNLLEYLNLKENKLEPVRFFDPDSGQPLDAGVYRYGQNKNATNITVVQNRPGSTIFNKGLPAIIVYYGKGRVNTPCVSRYAIWTPTGYRSDVFVERRITGPGIPLPPTASLSRRRRLPHSVPSTMRPPQDDDSVTDREMSILAPRFDLQRDLDHVHDMRCLKSESSPPTGYAEDLGAEVHLCHTLPAAPTWSDIVKQNARFHTRELKRDSPATPRSGDHCSVRRRLNDTLSPLAQSEANAESDGGGSPLVDPEMANSAFGAHLAATSPVCNPDQSDFAMLSRAHSTVFYFKHSLDDAKNGCIAKNLEKCDSIIRLFAFARGAQLNGKLRVEMLAAYVGENEEPVELVRGEEDDYRRLTDVIDEERLNSTTDRLEISILKIDV